MKRRVDEVNELRRIFDDVAVDVARCPQLLEWKDYKEPKTNPQLAIWHCHCRDIAKSQDQDPRVMKIRLKFALAFTEFVDTFKGSMEVPRSLETATLEEMSEMITKMEIIAVDNGIELTEKGHG